MIVLDTHAFVWWATGPRRLPAKARTAIDEAAAADQLAISCISLWEIVTLTACGRIVMCIDIDMWIRHAKAIPALQFVPVDTDIATRAARLPGLKSVDLADRIIVATALTLGATLVTADPKLRHYTAVTSLWS